MSSLSSTGVRHWTKRFKAPPPRSYLGAEIGLLSSDFINALPAHLPGDEASQAHIPVILRTPELLRAVRSKPRRRSAASHDAMLKLMTTGEIDSGHAYFAHPFSLWAPFIIVGEGGHRHTLKSEVIA
jgi:hypothetical protein